MAMKGVGVNKSTPMSVRSVYGAGARSIRNDVGRLEGLRTTKYRVTHLAIPSVRTTGTFGRVGSGTQVPLITSVRFSCELTLTTVGTNTSGVEVGPKGVNNRRGVERITTGTGSLGVPVQIKMGSNSLRESVVTTGKKIATGNLTRDIVEGITLLRGYNFRSVIISLGSSGIGVGYRTCGVIGRSYPCPLRVKIARTKASRVNGVGSTTKLKTLLLSNVKGAVEISLATSPTRRMVFTHGLLRTVNVEGDSFRVVSYPAYNEARIGLRTVTNEIRRRLTGHFEKGPCVVGKLGMTMVNYTIGNPKRTTKTSVKITYNGKRNLLFGVNGILEGMPRRSVIGRLIGLTRRRRGW